MAIAPAAVNWRTFARLNQELASISSSLRWPGTSATGIGNVPAVLARLETSGPGPSLPVPAASTRMPISASSSISLTISSGGIAFSDHAVGRDPRDFLRPCGEFVECGICRLPLFGHHDVGNAEPLLIAIARFDHPQHHDLRFGAAGALCRPVDRAVALLGIVDDHQILSLVAGLVAATLAAHGVDGGMPAAAPTRRGVSALQLAAHETDDILDSLHGFGGDYLRALRTVREDQSI